MKILICTLDGPPVEHLAVFPNGVNSVWLNGGLG